MSTIINPDANNPLLELDKVSVKIADKSILSDISLSVLPGKIVTLIGPNGAGKSTLVRVILGLIKQSSGHIARKKGLRIGYMPQHVHIEQTIPLTVSRFLTLAKRERGQNVDNVLHDVRAIHLKNNPVQNLSGGELQRILLARALLRSPELLVLDEPVQGVDMRGQAELYELIAAIRDKYCCGVLMVSHDLHLVMSSTDRVVCINHHVCCSGHPEHIGKDPAYQELFGLEHTDGLAVYSHHHDHDHDAKGNIIAGHNHG